MVGRAQLSSYTSPPSPGRIIQGWGEDSSKLSSGNSHTNSAFHREEELIIPHGDTVLRPSDEVLAVVLSSQKAQLASILGERST